MARFVKGEVVVVPFPYSDLMQAKRRPALVIAGLEGNDLILCQITSQTTRNKYAIPVNESDFESGSLKQASNVRPDRVSTIDSRAILYRIGTLKKSKLTEVVEAVIEIMRK